MPARCRVEAQGDCILFAQLLDDLAGEHVGLSHEGCDESIGRVQVEFARRADLLHPAIRHTMQCLLRGSHKELRAGLQHVRGIDQAPYGDPRFPPIPAFTPVPALPIAVV